MRYGKDCPKCKKGEVGFSTDDILEGREVMCDHCRARFIPLVALKEVEGAK